jgi:hypothetical protein
MNMSAMPRRSHRGKIMGCFLAMRMLVADAALERHAADAFFDVKSAMEKIAFSSGQPGWAETCFHSCRQSCLHGNEDQQPMDGLLKTMGWTHNEDCDYRCMQACIGANVEKGGRQWKYRGKWPHVRALGLREPLSTVFSVSPPLDARKMFPAACKRVTKIYTHI